MSIHTTTTAPAGARDLDGTSPAVDPEAHAAPSGSIRGFRAGSRGYSAPTTPDLDSSKGERANAHKGTGSPDARRGLTTVVSPDSQAVAPEHVETAAHPVVIVPEAPPARPRQGWTGEDNTRAATYRRPVFMRAFDKLIAEHPVHALKIEQDGPKAARPKDHLAAVSNPQPFAGGASGTGSEGIGPRPNSFRIMPRAWDSLLVNTGGPAVSPSNPDPALTAARSQRARSFRA